MLSRRWFGILVAITALGPAGGPVRADTASKARFDALLAELQGDAALAAQIRGATDKPILPKGARRADAKARPSKLKISSRAERLIVAAEVTGQTVYTKRYQGPIWPKGRSGVTVGIGYDIGHTIPEQFWYDWKDFINLESLDRLMIGCEATGEEAELLLEAIRDVRIPWDVAYRQFVRQQLPREIGLAERSLPNFADLPEDSRGALVSLTYNRGASRFAAAADPDDELDRGREMRAIYAHMQTRNFASIPNELIAMRRIWADNPDMTGVVKRREAEAALFQIGMDGLGDIPTGIVIR
jgi:hypothetical protein